MMLKAKTSLPPIPKFSLWSLFIALIALIFTAPIVIILWRSFAPTGELWQHFSKYLLLPYLLNSLTLIVGVTLGVLLLGLSAAWFVTMCNFPGRRIFQWALLLPMAFPAYILAYSYTDLLQYSGPVQSTLREVFDWSRGDYVFPQIRSRLGAVTMLSLALYPYVYMTSRASFLEQSASILEASRNLGRSAWASFVHISLPLARPAIVAGVALALMETLSDFGTVKYFSIKTLATGIYDYWIGFETTQKAFAAQLASILLTLVLILFFIEQLSRRRSKHQRQPGLGRYRRLSPYELKAWQKVIAFIICALPILLGFIIPIVNLLRMALPHMQLLGPELVRYIVNSFSLALITALLAVIIALILAYAARLRPSPSHKVLNRIAAIGYAVPGAVIAVGVLFFVGSLNNYLPDYLMIGGLVALVYAYLVRFLAVAYGPIEASLLKISANLDDAARNLGRKTWEILGYVHIPLLKSSLLSAMLLVFVDVIKELPASLIVRPFNFDTLAIRIYRLASDERLAEASVLAIVIVLVGLIPVIVLSLAIARSREH